MGILKTGFKAVVAVKTADVIHERILARQAAQWGEAGPPGPSAPLPPPARSGDETINRLKDLAELRANGVLTEAEFESQKARVLAG
jgi:hypothetical protein